MSFKVVPALRPVRISARTTVPVEAESQAGAPRTNGTQFNHARGAPSSPICSGRSESSLCLSSCTVAVRTHWAPASLHEDLRGEFLRPSLLAHLDIVQLLRRSQNSEDLAINSSWFTSEICLVSSSYFADSFVDNCSGKDGSRALHTTSTSDVLWIARLRQSATPPLAQSPTARLSPSTLADVVFVRASRN